MTSLICDICDLTFRTSSGYYQHRQVHHNCQSNSDCNKGTLNTAFCPDCGKPQVRRARSVSTKIKPVIYRQIFSGDKDYL